MNIECPNPRCKSLDVEVVNSMQTTQLRVLCRGCLMTGPMAQSTEAAWEAWEELPRNASPLFWSNDRPSTSDFYWQRALGIKTVVEVDLSKHKAWYPLSEFAGPIPYPLERK